MLADIFDYIIENSEFQATKSRAMMLDQGHLTFSNLSEDTAETEKEVRDLIEDVLERFDYIIEVESMAGTTYIYSNPYQ